MITYITGVMGAGKTDKLIKTYKKLTNLGHNVTILVPDKIDDGKLETEISSRNGSTAKAVLITSLLNIRNHLTENDIQYMLIDEAQFLAVDRIREIVRISHDLNIPTIFFGIKSDFNQKLFDGSSEIMVHCNEIHNIDKLCSCGKIARYNRRMTQKDNALNKNNYSAICAECLKLKVQK